MADGQDHRPATIPKLVAIGVPLSTDIGSVNEGQKF